MSIRILAVAWLTVVLSLGSGVQAADVRQAQKGESCAGFRKSCGAACPSGGGGAARKQCLGKCEASEEGCVRTGSWRGNDLQVDGLPPGK
jgi:hypothetical protein